MIELIPFKAGLVLRARLLEAASQLFSLYGYEHVSVRQIAQAAGCSQMAMYRHFPDKQALFSHLCMELYRKFTRDLHEQYDYLEAPGERIRMALRGFIALSAENPHHYRLIFLDSAPSEEVRAMRLEASAPTIGYIRENLRLAFPAEVSEQLLDERLHLILALVHGITVMLVLHGSNYGMNLETALQRFDAGYRMLLAAPTAPEATFPER